MLQIIAPTLPPVYNVTSRRIVQQTELRQGLKSTKGQAATICGGCRRPENGRALKDSKKTNLNAYLFVNILVTGILLIGLWTRKPVWDVSIRFPNMLLILIIINTILIFRDVLLTSGSAAARPIRARKSQARKKTRNLNELRAILKNSPEVDEEILQKALAKLQKIAGCETVALFNLDNRQCRLQASAGELPAALVGSRFALNEDSLLLKFPGNLGDENLGKLAGKAIIFKSSITRLELTVLPLTLNNNRLSLCVFSSRENHRPPPISLVSTALFLETLLTLISSEQNSEDNRYQDKNTGLFKHSCFADAFETEVERSERYKQEMSLLTLKIQSCESLTDNEQAMLARNAANALKQSLRRLDLMFCGHSKGEFLAILTETGVGVAQNVATRIQKSFAKSNEKLDFISKHNIVMVIGAATYPVDATHGQGLQEKSLEAMKQAVEKNISFTSYSPAAEGDNAQTDQGDNENEQDDKD